MFTKLDGNSLISSMLDVIRTIRIMRSPDTQRPLITNIPTQLFANRLLNVRAVWKQHGVKDPIQIELVGFAPARNPQTGEYSKDLASDIFRWYQTGLPSNDIATVEFGYLLSYFTGCFATGQLPTPSRLSGQSTIMAKIVQRWTDEANIKPLSVEILSDEGRSRMVSGDVIQSIQTIFVQNYDHIVETWNRGQSGQTSSKSRISW